MSVPPPQSSPWDFDNITSLMIDAGEIALTRFRSAQITVKPDRSLVTDADLAIETLCRSRLEDPDSGSYLIGEESEGDHDAGYFEAAMKGVTYIVDPIDGTINYASGNELWGISIGLMVAGRLLEGAVYLPIQGELFITSGDDVMACRIDGGRLAETEPVRFSAGLGGGKGLIAVTQLIAKQFSLPLPNPVHALGVAVYPLVNILRGRYDAVIGRVKLWDMAGSLPMLHRAGLDVFLKNGTSITDRVDDETYILDPGASNRWLLRDLMVVCPPAMRDQILQALDGIDHP